MPADFLGKKTTLLAIRHHVGPASPRLTHYTPATVTRLEETRLRGLPNSSHLQK